jgi:hypothetical protein
MRSVIHNIIIWWTATVWLVNGLVCKVLNIVPRHREIVANILGEDYATELTVTIGALEVLMAVWIISGIRSTWCAWFQILIVGVMNILEFVLVPDLLLFGRLNIVFAMLFMIVVYIGKRTAPQTKNTHA